MKKKCALVLALVVALCALVSVGLTEDDTERWLYSVLIDSCDDEDFQILDAHTQRRYDPVAVCLSVPKENKYTGKPVSASVVDFLNPSHKKTWSQVFYSFPTTRLCKPPTNNDIMYEYPDGKDYPTPPTEPGKYKAKITACDPKFPDAFSATLVEEFEILEPEKSNSKLNTIRELLQKVKKN